MFNCFKRNRNPSPGPVILPEKKPEPVNVNRNRDETFFDTAYRTAKYEDTVFRPQLVHIKEEFEKYAPRYKYVEEKTGVPSRVICAIHALECSLSFNKILHNGEKISDVIRRGTIYVPKNIGKGKDWSWEDFAVDALKREKSKFPNQWDIDGTLDFLERYNGLGYRKYHPEVKTPYLYSGTQFYTKGKYTEKRNWLGVIKSYFDKNLVSKQVGCIPILKTLGYEGLV